MPRPRTNKKSAYDTALRFMIEKHGPRPRLWSLQKMKWDDMLSIATDIIAFDRREQKANKP